MLLCRGDTVAAFITALVLEDRTCRQRRQDTKTGLLQLARGVICEDDASPHRSERCVNICRFVVAMYMLQNERTNLQDCLPVYPPVGLP